MLSSGRTSWVRHLSRWVEVRSESWTDVRLLQCSVLGLLLLDLALQGVGGVLETRSAASWTAIVLIAAATAFPLAVPVLAIRAGWVVVLCLVDLAAIGLVRLAPYDGGVAIASVLPAVWLGAVLGRAGALLAALGSALLITLPGLLYDGWRGEFLASSLPVPVVALAVGLAVSEGLRRAGAARGESDQARTDLQVAHEALAAESCRNRAIIATVDIGLLLVDAEGTIDYANPLAIDALTLAFPQGYAGQTSGSAESQVFDEHGGDLLGGPDRPIARLARGEEFSDLRVWIGPRGARRLLLVSGRLVDQDATGGGVITFTDITEKERALRLRSSFVNAVAHELRTPLMSLDAHLHLLQDVPDLPDEARSLLPALDRSSKRLRRLGAQLVRDSTDRQWSVRATREPVDLDELVEGICHDFREQHALPGSLRIDHHPASSHLVTSVDTVLITRMMCELLSNACAHAPEQTAVTVGLAAAGPRGESVEITVTDEGNGIDSSRHLSIFEPTREMLSDHGELSGLPMCRAVAAAHDGQLDIDSRLGEGTTIIVVLPLDRG